MKTILQFSDLHIQPEGMPMNGHDTYERALRAINHAKTLETKPSVILITGDCINEKENEASYKRLRLLTDILSEHYDVPVLLGVGNHDVRADLRRFYLGEPASDAPYYYAHVVGDLRIIMLDTQIPKFTPGKLDAIQLKWLADELDRPFIGDTVLALHHSPIAISATRFMPYQLTNAAELEAVLAPRSHQLCGIVYGHIHHTNIGICAGLPCVSAPGVAFGIAPDAQQGLRLVDSMGYNLINIIDGKMIVNPIMVQSETQQITYDRVMGWP
jgi:3',5'-cyclic AMP phosphodiesterase CpdA